MDVEHLLRGIAILVANRNPRVVRQQRVGEIDALARTVAILKAKDVRTRGNWHCGVHVDADGAKTVTELVHRWNVDAPKRQGEWPGVDAGAELGDDSLTVPLGFLWRATPVAVAIETGDDGVCQGCPRCQAQLDRHAFACHRDARGLQILVEPMCL